MEHDAGPPCRLVEHAPPPPRRRPRRSCRERRRRARRPAPPWPRRRRRWSPAARARRARRRLRPRPAWRCRRRRRPRPPAAGRSPDTCGSCRVAAGPCRAPATCPVMRAMLASNAGRSSSSAGVGISSRRIVARDVSSRTGPARAGRRIGSVGLHHACARRGSAPQNRTPLSWRQPRVFERQLAHPHAARDFLDAGQRRAELRAQSLAPRRAGALARPPTPRSTPARSLDKRLGQRRAFGARPGQLVEHPLEGRRQRLAG